MLPALPHRFFEGGGLPVAYSANGLSVTFNTDFRAWLKYEFLQNQKDLTRGEKTRACATMCCSGPIIHSPDFLCDGMIWFHTCADVERMSQITIVKAASDAMNKRPRHFSLFWDFRQVWGSFKQQYDIDLYACGELHWWEFRRLYEGLKSDTPVASLRGLRSVTEAEFTQDEKSMKNRRKQEWIDVILDQKYAALPDEG